MSAGIQHLLKGGRESNRIGESRVDKIETDRLNSIVERISGVNPSKLAALVTKEEVQTFPGARVATSPVEKPAVGPGPRLGSSLPWGGESGGNATVDQLSKQVQMLEQRLARYEVFNANDNDVVSTTTTPAGKLNRGADSSAYGSGAIRKKNAKSKDPVDGKPDKQTEPNMAGERVTILGISMNEWRSMAGLSAPVLKAPAVVESYEDEDEIDEASASTRGALRDIGVSNKETQEPKPPPSDPAGRAKAGMKPLAASGRGGTPAVRSALAGISAMNSKRRNANEEMELWAQFLAHYDTTPAQFAEFVEAADDAGDEEALLAVAELEDEFIEAIGAEVDLPIEEDVEQLWAQWLEARDLSVEMFDALVDAVETEDDISTLESLQAMFEAEVLRGTSVAGGSPTPSIKSKLRFGGKDVETTSVVGNGLPTRSAKDRQKDLSIPKHLLPKAKAEDVDEDFFECDSDESGGPDMKHPGWAKARKKFSKAFKKSGRKS